MGPFAVVICRIMPVLLVLLAYLSSQAFAATTPPPAFALFEMPQVAICGGTGGAFAPVSSPHAPAVCLPDPCQKALDRQTLGRDIMGRVPTAPQWSAYESRYAEICRAEAVNPTDAPRVRTTEEFWAPFLHSPAVDRWREDHPDLLSVWTGRQTLSAGFDPRSSGGSRPGGAIAALSGSAGGVKTIARTSSDAGRSDPDTPSPGLSPQDGRPAASPGPDGATPGGGALGNGGTSTPPGGPVHAVVPLPMTAWLSLSALLGLLVATRRERESHRCIRMPPQP